MESNVRETKDPYLLALAANVFAARELPEARGLIARLAAMQLPDGSLQFAPGRSVTESWQAQENTIRSEP